MAGKPGSGNKNGRRKYTINHEFFDGSLLSCYWAGFIAADGCIIDGNGQHGVKIKLSEKDRPHLERFCLDAGSDSPVKSSERGYCYVSLHSAQWVRTLAQRLHITPRKSKTLRPPVGLTEAQALAFIAGLIDGDGCISYSRYSYGKKNSPVTEYPSIDVCGTTPMMDWVKGFMDKFVPSNRQAAVCFYKSGLARWKAGGKRAVEIKRCIEDLDLPLLARKWNRIQFEKRAVS